MSITGYTIIGTGNQGGEFRKFPSNDCTWRIDSLTVVIDSVTVTVTARRLSNLFFRVFVFSPRNLFVASERPFGKNRQKTPKVLFFLLSLQYLYRRFMDNRCKSLQHCSVAIVFHRQVFDFVVPSLFQPFDRFIPWLRFLSHR